ncbi:hypothetical protein P8605_27235 [Streptomyces sp. T-3]|nr:hypothetical protein [Streptomyces sp. T-3]
MMIETLEFTEAHDVKLTGYVWQHLPASDPAQKPQVELPDAVDGGMGDEFFRDPDGDRQVVGCKLRVTLREHFDYSLCPLDKQVVWLVMWPRATNTVLVPGFAARPPWNPDENLGMYPGLVTGEWQRQFTTYSLDHAKECRSWRRWPCSCCDGRAVTAVRRRV